MNLTKDQKKLLEEFNSGDVDTQLKVWQKISEDREFLIYVYRTRTEKKTVDGQKETEQSLFNAETKNKEAGKTEKQKLLSS